MALKHKHDPAEYAARQKARKEVATGNGGNESVKTRIDRLEKALGMVPAAK